MPLEPLWTGSQLLRKLVADFLRGELRAVTFCRDVEVAYNDALDEKALMASEQPIFEALFDQVVWFNPDPPEMWGYPGHRTEEQIKAIAKATAERLSRI